MTHRSLIVSGVFVLALALQTRVAYAQDGRIEVPEVPATLTVPDGNVAYLQTRAYGTQNYICVPTSTGVAWKLFGPQATLYLPSFPQQAATHFLSANPDEQGLARPTWQHSLDSSTVWGRLYAPASSDANYVAAGAIPWLLLEAAGKADGPTGGTLLSRTTYIHRVNTQGGVAPATGCTDATQLGTFVLVPYSTDYFFYRARRPR